MGRAGRVVDEVEVGSAAGGGVAVGSLRSNSGVKIFCVQWSRFPNTHGRPHHPHYSHPTLILRTLILFFVPLFAFCVQWSRYSNTHGRLHHTRAAHSTRTRRCCSRSRRTTCCGTWYVLFPRRAAREGPSTITSTHARAHAKQRANKHSSRCAGTARRSGAGAGAHARHTAHRGGLVDASLGISGGEHRRRGAWRARGAGTVRSGWAGCAAAAALDARAGTAADCGRLGAGLRRAVPRAERCGGERCRGYRVLSGSSEHVRSALHRMLFGSLPRHAHRKIGIVGIAWRGMLTSWLEVMAT